MKTLVIGSLNMDMTLSVDNFPQIGETIIGKSFATNFGGKGFNQAIAIRRAGGEVAMLGKVGDDDYGQQFIKALNKEKIQCLVKTTSKSNTGLAFIEVDKQGSNKIIVIQGANERLSKEDIKNAISSNQYSSLLVQMEIPIELVEYSINLAHNAKMIVVVNPAPASMINELYYQYIDYFTPNEKELDFYMPNELHQVGIKEKLAYLLNKGIKNIIVTIGEKGCIIANKKNYQFIEANKVEAIDTVGAGDCFNGYFIEGLNNNLSMEEAAKFASLAASIEVTSNGVYEAIPVYDKEKKEFKKWKKQK